MANCVASVSVSEDESDEAASSSSSQDSAMGAFLGFELFACFVDAAVSTARSWRSFDRP